MSTNMVTEIATSGEQAKEALNVMLLQLVQSIESGLDIAKVEIPIVLQQLILRDQIFHTITFLMMIGIFGVFAYSMKKGFKNDFFGSSDPKPIFFVTLISGFASVFCLPVYFGAGAFCKFITVWAAPKLYIIEYLADKIG